MNHAWRPLGAVEEEPAHAEERHRLGQPARQPAPLHLLHQQREQLGVGPPRWRGAARARTRRALARHEREREHGGWLAARAVRPRGRGSHCEDGPAVEHILAQPDGELLAQRTLHRLRAPCRHVALEHQLHLRRRTF